MVAQLSVDAINKDLCVIDQVSAYPLGCYREVSNRPSQGLQAQFWARECKHPHDGIVVLVLEVERCVEHCGAERTSRNLDRTRLHRGHQR